MKKILSFLLFFSISATAQRSLPYPIILIHGFTGNGGAYWSGLYSYFASAGLTIEINTLDYNLNADGNLNYSDKSSDVAQITPLVIGNHDVYAINFDTGNLSNQSAAVKQGYALKFAIQRVLDATGAKKVILLGHSMGGLAAREYIQNPSNWQADGQHHIAKLVTLGTPHGGSDLGTDGFNIGFFNGYDERSEAVRDLRTNFTTGFKGVYLYGGYESAQYIQRGSLGGTYFNLDVNCNGQVGDYIVGLNEKPIDTNLAYACVIGRGVLGIFGDSDGVVLTASQSLNGRYNNFTADLFYHQCKNSLNYTCHTNEPKDAILSILRALDEPATSKLAYEIDITNLEVKQGFFTTQASNNQIDTDRYKFKIDQGGLLTINAAITQEANGGITVMDGNEEPIAFLQGTSIQKSLKLPQGGTYYIDFVGLSNAGWENRYAYSMSFCPLPNPPTVLASGSATFCEGGKIVLSTTAQLDNYTWLRDGVRIGPNGNTLTVAESGNFTLQTAACGSIISAINGIAVRVNPIPAKPLIAIQSQPFGLLATNAVNYQWYQNGQKIANATGALFSAVSSGAYTVRTTVSDCTAESLPFVVTGTEDEPKDLITVYPNPTDGKLSIELPLRTGATVELLDPTGRPIYMHSDKAKTSRKTIDARPIVPGAYLLKVIYDQKEITRKIIVE